MVQSHLVVIGSSNTDLVIRCRQLPRRGETIIGGDFRIHHGGKGANQAVAAARAGARVTLVGNIGRDPFGDAAIQQLQRERIDTRFIVRSKTSPSGVALILVDARGENLIGVAPGSNLELSPRDVRAAESAICAARCVVVQLEVSMAAVREAMKLARRHHVPIVLNPAPAQKVPTTLLRQAKFLTPNESELAALTDQPTRTKSQIERGAGRLHSVGVQHVLVTCGARGVCWCSETGTCWFPVPRVKAVDTVGAGDCFSGALATAIAEGRTVEDAIRFAVAAAAISVTRAGAQPSMPRRREILRVVRRA
jgi:ribokinase